VREFFRVWRRKAGVVTLAIALLLTVVWNRSYQIADRIGVQRDQTTHCIKSCCGSVSWTRFTDDDAVEWSSERALDVQPDRYGDETIYERRWSCGAIDLWAGAFIMHDSYRLLGWQHRAERCIIPYWPIVLSVTVLSAWLLLIKPRPAKSAKESSRA
jgi:hypothetical protein